MASPETPTAPSGTVIWLMSTIGSQLGTVLASDIQNGISCPMLESWRKLSLSFLGGGLDLLPWILQNPLFLGTKEMVPILHALWQSIATKMPDADPDEVQATCFASSFVPGQKLRLKGLIDEGPLLMHKIAVFECMIYSE